MGDPHHIVKVASNNLPEETFHFSNRKWLERKSKPLLGSDSLHAYGFSTLSCCVKQQEATRPVGGSFPSTNGRSRRRATYYIECSILEVTSSTKTRNWDNLSYQEMSDQLKLIHKFWLSCPRQQRTTSQLRSTMDWWVRSCSSNVARTGSLAL